jgi:Mycothiol maleylpyruvate isomerase N-terminal domain.
MQAQQTSDDLRYPVGKFDKTLEPTPELRREFVKIIADLPSNVSNAINGLTDEQLDTPYRPEGWTVRQTVHHIADSHLNSFCRFKLALTEDTPTIRPYYEDRWAELPDSDMPVETSIKIIDGLHSRWTALLNSMSDTDFQKKLNHPESGEWTLDKMLGMYAWHSQHHTAHITNLRNRNGW